MSKFDYSTFLSPFTWRYGSQEMRKIFSEQYKYQSWRRVWTALAKAQHVFGLLSDEELKDIETNQINIDVERILEIEKDTKHDLVAALREFSEKAKIGGKKLHLGATSQDIIDNAEMLRNKEALGLVKKRVTEVLQLLAEKIEKYKDLPCMGYTHLQPAEPTTLGYRFAFYAQDLLNDINILDFVQKTIKGKGLKGAVGTSASFQTILKDKNASADDLEKKFMQELELEPVAISSQVYPRKFDFLILDSLSSISSSIAKFAFDLRIMQSPGFGEWQEPFGEKQVGSSAMPFKRNPFTAEKICSLARFMNLLPPIALENASVSLLERTLDDSANKRIVMAEGFLAVDDILVTAAKIIKGIVINTEKIKYNLEQYAPFSATEVIILEAVKNGANRQEAHELLRNISMQAWQDVQNGKPNPMTQLLLESKDLAKYIDKETIKEALAVETHIGLAPKKCVEFLNKLRTEL